MMRISLVLPRHQRLAAGCSVAESRRDPDLWNVAMTSQSVSLPVTRRHSSNCSMCHPCLHAVSPSPAYIISRRRLYYRSLYNHRPLVVNAPLMTRNCYLLPPDQLIDGHDVLLLLTSANAEDTLSDRCVCHVCHSVCLCVQLHANNCAWICMNFFLPKVGLKMSSVSR